MSASGASGVGGLRPIDAYPLDEPEQAAEAAPPQTPPSSPVVRGETSSPPPVDLGASLLGADLQEAEAVSAVESDDKQWIEEELEFLYAYEEMLLEELADPNIDWWDETWLEYDLWDVQAEIADLEADLGKIEENEWLSFMSEFSQWLSDDIFLTFEIDRIGLEAQQSGFKAWSSAIKQRRESPVEQARERDERKRQIQRAAASVGREVPPLTAELRALCERMQPRWREFAENPTREGLTRLREEIAEMRGAHSQRPWRKE